MIRIAVFAEHAPIGHAVAATLAAGGRIEIAAVLCGAGALQSSGPREALSAAAALVYIPERPVHELPPELRPRPAGRWWSST